MSVEPYLFFEGRCDEAIEFYKKALGAQVRMVMRYKESPDPPPPGMVPPGSEDKVMHASFTVEGTTIMMSDGGVSGRPNFQGFSLAVNVKRLEDTDRYFNALAEGGKVQMPLGKTFWSPRFGMVADRFGVQWMIGVAE
jgi:PhnB protein